MVYFPERMMTVSESCQGNGNYMPNQNVGDVFYCVDTDGYRTTDFLDAWPTDRCSSFAWVPSFVKRVHLMIGSYRWYKIYFSKILCYFKSFIAKKENPMLYNLPILISLVG